MGRLLEDQRSVVSQFVGGQRVTDYGAGNLVLTRQLLTLGAEHVVAVDSEPSHDPGEPRITRVTAWFEDHQPSTSVAFVSWPVNWRTELHSLLDATPTVIYLGSNLDGNACGYPVMYRQLAKREVLAHVPAFNNTLIVYGPEKVRRAPLPEEYAGIHTDEPYRCFKDVYAIGGDPSRGGGHPTLSPNGPPIESVANNKVRGT